MVCLPNKYNPWEAIDKPTSNSPATPNLIFLDSEKLKYAKASKDPKTEKFPAERTTSSV